MNLTDILGDNLKDNTEQVKAEQVTAEPAKSGINEPVTFTPEEIAMILNQRKGSKASAYIQDPDKVFKDVPGWGVIDKLISKVIPKGYGTKLISLAAIVVGVLEMFGVDIPMVTIPSDIQADTGAGGLLYVLLGAVAYFIRRAIK